MSGRVNIICVFLANVLLLSCKQEVDYGIGEYRVDWVKVLSPRTFSMLNQEETLLEGDRSLSNIEEGDRILLNYSRLKERDNGFTVKINGGSSVLCDTVMKKSPITEQLKSAPVKLESAWIGRSYLNVSCYVDLYGKGPVIALVLDRSDGNTYHLSFIYDKKNDPAGYRTKVNCSFDLSKIAGMPANEKIIMITFNDKNNNTLKFYY